MLYLDTFCPSLRIYRASSNGRDLFIGNPVGSLFDQTSFIVPENESLFVPSMGCVTPIESVDIFGSNVPRKILTIQSRSNALNAFGLLLAPGSKIAQMAELRIFDDFDATEMDISYIEGSVVPTIKYTGPERYCRWTVLPA